MMPSGIAHRLSVLAVKPWVVTSMEPVTQGLLTPNGHNLLWPHLTLLTFSALIQHLSPPRLPRTRRNGPLAGVPPSSPKLHQLRRPV